MYYNAFLLNIWNSQQPQVCNLFALPTWYSPQVDINAFTWIFKWEIIPKNYGNFISSKAGWRFFIQFGSITLPNFGEFPFDLKIKKSIHAILQVLLSLGSDFHYNVLPWIITNFIFLNVLLLSNLVSLKSSYTKKTQCLLKANWLISIALPISLYTLCFSSISFKENNDALAFIVFCVIQSWLINLFLDSHTLSSSPAAPCCSRVPVCGWNPDALEMTCKDTELTACSKSFKSAFLLIFQSEKQTLKYAWSRLFKAVKKIGIWALSRDYL